MRSKRLAAFVGKNLAVLLHGFAFKFPPYIQKELAGKKGQKWLCVSRESDKHSTRFEKAETAN